MPKKNTQFQKKQLQALNSFEDHLKKIYHSATDGQDTVGRLVIRKSSWMRRVIMAEIAVFACMLLAFGGIYLAQRGSQDSPSLEVSFEMPRSIASGDVSIFVLRYKNTEHFSLLDAELVIQYPENFQFVAATPEPKNSYHDIWKLGDLVKGEEGKIVIRGKVLGEVGSPVVLRGRFNYQPQNFSSVFTNNFSSPTAQISSSVIGLTVEGPATLVPDQNATYKIIYTNTAYQDLHDVRVRLDYPKNFTPLDIVPPSQQQAAGAIAAGGTDQLYQIWEIKELTYGESGEITVSGRFAAEDGENEQLHVQVGVLQDTKEISFFQKKTIAIELVRHSLKVEVLANGQKSNQSVNFGDTLNYTIIFKNLGSKTIHNVVMNAHLASRVVDWETLLDTNKGAVVGETITWSSSTVPTLAILKPLDEGEIHFSVRLKPAVEVNVLTDDLATSLTVESNIFKIDDFETRVALMTEPVVAQINTALDMKVEGRYFDDDNIAVGQGPLPPVVGKSTVFRIFWNLSNNLHEVSDVVMKTKLGPNVEWEDKFIASIGTLIYNPNDSTVTWKIPKVAANKTHEDLAVWYDVSITPTASDIGKLIPLTTETTLAAKDEVTKSAVTQLDGAITSNLEDDPIGGGRGLVVGNGQDSPEL